MTRRTQKLYLASLGLYVVSFALPTVINPHPTPGFGSVETWGWEAALLSVQTPAVIIVGPANVGYAFAALLLIRRQPHRHGVFGRLFYRWRIAESCCRRSRVAVPFDGPAAIWVRGTTRGSRRAS